MSPVRARQSQAKRWFPVSALRSSCPAVCRPKHWFQSTACHSFQQVLYQILFQHRLYQSNGLAREYPFYLLPGTRHTLKYWQIPRLPYIPERSVLLHFRHCSKQVQHRFYHRSHRDQQRPGYGQDCFARFWSHSIEHVRAVNTRASSQNTVRQIP